MGRSSTDPCPAGPLSSPRHSRCRTHPWQPLSPLRLDAQQDASLTAQDRVLRVCGKLIRLQPHRSWGAHRVSHTDPTGSMQTLESRAVFPTSPLPDLSSFPAHTCPQTQATQPFSKIADHVTSFSINCWCKSTVVSWAYTHTRKHTHNGQEPEYRDHPQSTLDPSRAPFHSQPQTTTNLGVSGVISLHY